MLAPRVTNMTGDPQNRFPFDDGPQDTDGDGERCYQIAESKHITDDLQVVDAVYTDDDLEERLDDLTALDDAE